MDLKIGEVILDYLDPHETFKVEQVGRSISQRDAAQKEAEEMWRVRGICGVVADSET